MQIRDHVRLVEAFTASLNEMTRPETTEQAYAILARAGYALLGSGAFGAVFQKPGAPYVLKVFTARDDAYQMFLDLALDHQENKHFPKFKGKSILISPGVMAIRMEKLESVDSWDIRHVVAYMGGEDHPRYHDALEFLEDFPELREACDLILTVGYELDLKPNNFMHRNGTLVFTDPIYSEWED